MRTVDLIVRKDKTASALIHWPSAVASGLKALLHAASARSTPDLWQATADALKRLTPTDCRNYLIAAGYDETW
jgi:hypothetical protein